MIVVTLVGVFISGFLFGAVLGFRRLEDWFDPWIPDAVSTRIRITGWDDVEGTGVIVDDGSQQWQVTGDVPPESTTETLR